MTRNLILGLTATSLVLGGAGVALAQGPSLAMLQKLDRGNWDIRYRGAAGDVTNLCLARGTELIQLSHRRQNCSRVVVAGSDKQVTVQYTCPGKGYGRTTVRREASNLVQIDSQGIENGLPFAYSAEARRTGACR